MTRGKDAHRESGRQDCVRPWYLEWFKEDYLALYEHRDRAEAAEVVTLALEITGVKPGAAILDLACGSGRHALELSLRGFRVVALDRSEVLLRLACRDAHKEGRPLAAVLGDMMHLPFGQAYDLVASFFTSFGYFETDEENQQVLNNIAMALHCGGSCFIDYLNPDSVLQGLVARDQRKIGSAIVIQERSYDAESKRLRKQITFQHRDATRRYLESVRLYCVEEMEAMLEAAGLEPTHILGSYEGEGFTPASPRMILAGRKHV